MEEIDYNILLRWFVGLNLDDEVWDATVFTKNRDRLLEAEVAKDFLALVVEQVRGQGWASDEHFTVDGTLLEAWASAKSFQPKNKKGSFPPEDPGNPTVNYRGEKRSNQRTSRKAIGSSLGNDRRVDYSRRTKMTAPTTVETTVWFDQRSLRSTVQRLSALVRASPGHPPLISD